METHRVLRFLLLSVLTLHVNSSVLGDVLLVVSDDGSDLTFQWTGKMDPGGSGVRNVTNNYDIFNVASQTAISIQGSNYFLRGSGTLSGNDVWILPGGRSNVPSTGSGPGFGFG